MAAASVWTPELVDELCGLWPKLVASEIAAAFARKGFYFTRNAIIGKASRLGLASRTGAPPKAAKPRPARTTPFKPPPPASEAPIKPPLPFVPRVVDTSPRMIPFAELNDSLCKYDCSGQHDASLFAFCGRPNNGTPYCAAHARLCYTPAPTRRRPYGRAA